VSPQRWREIEELYHAARESGNAILDGADPEIRREVERLLAQDSESGGKLLDQRAADLMTDAAPSEITAGSRLGPYEVEALLGQGGMGKVFRATDTRLGRKVALKIANQEFIHRFEQESRAIAALNHPRICTLHDVGFNYLVMELVEGETLAARLKRGRLSTAEIMRFGAQIAEALATAHAKGIVHCDLKPGNIMLTKSGIKVLDFGLAKSTADPPGSNEIAEVGTPAYMAPEQWEGKPPDARTDIHALGLVLSEMLADRRGAQPEDLPPGVERVIERCLEEDPEQRWQSARDLQWELEASASAIPPPARRLGTRALAGAAGIIVLLLAALAFVYFREQPRSARTARMSILIPEKSRVRSLAVAPDGSAIAMVLVREGKQQIWMRALDALEPVPLTGTDGAADPFWSPDSRFIGFFADDRLKKIERSGGPAQTLCDAHAVVGGAWNRRGDILMGGLFRVQRVSDTGGPVTDLPGAQASWPVFLPDGQHFLATRDAIWLRSMTGGEERRILPDVSNVQVLERLPGREVGAVLFTRAGALMALPFDMKRLEPAGEPFTVARGITATNSGWLAAASGQGTLAYVSGQEPADPNHPGSQSQFVWRDRKGQYLGAFGDAGGVAMISPDGRRLAEDWPAEISVLELATGVATRLTFRPSWGQNPIWSSDGRYIAYNSAGGIFRRPANGAGGEELLVKGDTLAVPKSWSPDGQFLLYAQVNGGSGADLFAIAVHGGRKPFVIAQTAATEDQGQFSPDGRWIAYTSTESGQGEVYVIPFPPSPGGGKWMVSRGGGVMPRWRRDGRELFYISPESEMMAVEVGAGPVFHAGNPQALFRTDIVDTGIRTGPISWDLTPDGKRFLIISPKSQYTVSITVALNWRPGG
jgi:Tol biopolymer transport system component/predicted Ser/Thr protein kinase